MKKVSVIILNWNGSKLLRKYLPSVVQYTNGDIAEVVVADNGSTDDSLQIIREEFPSVRLITFDQNYGFAKGYNLAISQIRTPYCLLLNDDVRVTDHWLEPLLDYMETHPEVGALQPKLLSDREPQSFEYAGACGGFLDKHGYPFCRGRIFDVTETDNGQYDDVAQIMWATGACLMMRTELYRRVGGLDELFFAHMEEIDLCWRVRNLGFGIVCVPQSKVYHYGGGSLAMGNPRKTKLNFRNSLLMLYKNLPARSRRSTIITRLLLDGVAALNFLLHGEFMQVKAIWDAHREADSLYRNVYRNLYYNNIEEAKPKQFDEEKLNILVEYYIKRHKKYTQLKT